MTHHGLQDKHLRKQQQAEEIRLLRRYRDSVQLLEQLQTQLAVLVEEQRNLLEEQQALLRLLLAKED